MLKPRRGGFVPWGLPGPTRGRRDAAVFKLASKTKPPSQGPGTPAARMEGPSRGGARAGPGPTDYTSLHPVHPSGRPWASERTPGKHIISNIIFCPLYIFLFFMYGEVVRYVRYRTYGTVLR